MKITSKYLLLLIIATSFAFYSCDSDDDSDSSGIPSDSEAAANPVLTETNTVIPNAQFSAEGNSGVIGINFTGILHPETKEWLELYGTSLANQNVWVEVDGTPKGILVYNNAANKQNQKPIYADLVFLVDNSGSMGQEADSVANGILKWATNLSKKGLDIQFGCVGYTSGINGSLGLSGLSEINAYLNRKSRKGTNRTVGYSGADSLKLLTAAKGYQHGRDECGSEALRFADENFSFRSSANRIYVNFTDESNQPGGLEEWSVEYVADQNKWNTSQGTIHTVFSADTNFYKRPYYDERPWLMSDYTGGTKMFVPSTFANVTLDDLPVTGAMVNSYIIRFNNTSDLANGTHEVKITIQSSDKKVKAEKVFKNVKFGE